MQERLKQLEAKRIEKERNEKYQKLKGDAKDQRQKYREKYKLDNSPDPSDAEDESDDDEEEDGFGARKKEEDQDPAASKSKIYVWKCYLNFFQSIAHFTLHPQRLVIFSEAKKLADQAMKDPMSLVNNVGALKFW